MPSLSEIPDHRVNELALLHYYEKFFPFKKVFQWLNRSPAPNHNFTHREIAFTLQNDVYLRYQAFESADAFKKEVIAKNPQRFEIGPVYSADPTKRKIIRAGAFNPLMKELVFDIDLTDYDDIRTCCSGTSICTRCWKFITLSLRILSESLRTDFGFKHILFVYSGRRGAHIWVCDAKARKMNDRQRKAIAGYLNIASNSKGGKRIGSLFRPLYPRIESSLDMLRTDFKSFILEDQDAFASEERAMMLAGWITNREVQDQLKSLWEGQGIRSSNSRWSDIDTATAAVTKKSTSKWAKDIPRLLKENKQDIILETMYPRLDVNVSVHLNHLLKSPFCVHPGTGRVCVPIDPENIEDFNPFQVPTLNLLLGDEYDDAVVKDTPLQPYLEYFGRFVKSVMDEELEIRKETKTDTLEF